MSNKTRTRMIHKLLDIYSTSFVFLVCISANSVIVLLSSRFSGNFCSVDGNVKLDSLSQVIVFLREFLINFNWETLALLRM